MKSILSLIFLTISLVFTAQDYVEEDSTSTSTRNYDLLEHLYFTGSMSLQFGTINVIGANPGVGYKITDNFSAGIGATYFRIKQTGFNPYSYYGANLFAKYIIMDNFFIQSEYHLLNLEVLTTTENYNIGDRATIPFLYFGGGYRQEVGGGVYFIISALWDVIEKPESPFINPLIRGGISVGF